MDTNRRDLVRSSVGALIGGLVAGLAASDVAGAATGAAPSGEFALRIVRVFTDANGDATFEVLQPDPKTRDFFGVKGGLKEYLRYPAKKVSVFSAPPNVDLPAHNTNEGEMFYMIRGSSELILLDGRTHRIEAGDLVMMEDFGSKGRRGRTGPQGYTAINIGYEKQP